ncbi:hypothetical protein CC80DRAFT_281678 [Byssothecium circinans]|uniref:Uncharacterized protein n=1 Tax=Byssothecium circinans TaxID=147558 RepID=A0A6A5TBF8_9PLEO|nr:hypothetical protein CC80DRAFT_281678 [Byssothecium circinans]
MAPLATPYGKIRAEELAYPIMRQMGRKFQLGRSSIFRTLRTLLGTLKPRSRGGIWSPSRAQQRIEDILLNMLAGDLRRTTWSGLSGPRHKFVVLCYIARTWGSFPLAEALYRFISSAVPQITMCENAIYLHEWELGVRKLRYLIGEDLCANILFQLGFSEPWGYGRGRRTLRLPEYRPRAITAPPFVRYRSPSRMPLQQLPAPGYYPEFPSPGLDPEVEELMDRQEMLEAKVQELEDEVAGPSPVYRPMATRLIANY